MAQPIEGRRKRELAGQGTLEDEMLFQRGLGKIPDIQRKRMGRRIAGLLNFQTIGARRDAFELKKAILADRLLKGCATQAVIGPWLSDSRRLQRREARDALPR